MPSLSTFLMCRWRTVLLLLLLSPFVCLEPSAVAQHGGGGGHGGGFGGHFGGGHHVGGHHGGGHSSSAHAHSNRQGGHSEGHWGWLHFRSHGRNGGGSSPANVATSPSRTASELRRDLVPAHSFPTTYIAKLPASFVNSPAEQRFSTFPHVRRNFFPRGFCRFHSSGCFFNGFNQVCFFEPAWPLYGYFSSFWFPFDSGYSDEGRDASDASPSADTMQEASPPDAESGATNTQAKTNPAPPLRGLDLDSRFFLLILKNGTEHVVTDYWLADGYIEYISRDGAQSHIPVDSLDLDQTVRSNSARGLRFVLRSAP